MVAAHTDRRAAPEEVLDLALAHGARAGRGPLPGPGRGADALCRLAHPPERVGARRQPPHAHRRRGSHRRGQHQPPGRPGHRRSRGTRHRALPPRGAEPRSDAAGRLRGRRRRQRAGLRGGHGQGGTGATGGRSPGSDRRRAGGGPGRQRRLLDRRLDHRHRQHQRPALPPHHHPGQAADGDDRRRPGVRLRAGDRHRCGRHRRGRRGRRGGRQGSALRRRDRPGARCLRRHPGGVRGPDHPRVPRLCRLLGAGRRGGALVHGPGQPGHGRQRQHLG